ncbi:hypothetical protein E2320_022252, partial [Naja naja]
MGDMARFSTAGSPHDQLCLVCLFQECVGDIPEQPGGTCHLGWKFGLQLNLSTILSLAVSSQAGWISGVFKLLLPFDQDQGFPPHSFSAKFARIFIEKKTKCGTRWFGRRKKARYFVVS